MVANGNAGSLHTKKAWSVTERELREEFRLWRIKDYRIPRARDTAVGRPVTVEFWPPGAKTMTQVTCGNFPDPRVNLRAILQAVEAVRKMDQQRRSQ